MAGGALVRRVRDPRLEDPPLLHLPRPGLCREGHRPLPVAQGRAIAAMLLRIENLRKSYGSLVATDKLSLSVIEGEALGIIGPNGAGKTTLFSLITGAVAPHAGSIHLDGDDITRVPAQRRCLA